MIVYVVDAYNATKDESAVLVYRDRRDAAEALAGLITGGPAGDVWFGQVVKRVVR